MDNEKTEKRVIFKPSKIGMEFKQNIITDVVKDGQAYQLGVRCGWKVLEVNGIDYQNNGIDYQNNDNKILKAVQELVKIGKQIEINFRVIADIILSGLEESHMLYNAMGRYAVTEKNIGDRILFTQTDNNKFQANLWYIKTKAQWIVGNVKDIGTGSGWMYVQDDIDSYTPADLHNPWMVLGKKGWANESNLLCYRPDVITYVKVTHRIGIVIRQKAEYPGERTGEIAVKDSVHRCVEKRFILHENVKISFYKLDDNRGWIYNYNPLDAEALDGLVEIQVGEVAVKEEEGKEKEGESNKAEEQKKKEEEEKRRREEVQRKREREAKEKEIERRAREEIKKKQDAEKKAEEAKRKADAERAEEAKKRAEAEEAKERKKKEDAEKKRVEEAKIKAINEKKAMEAKKKAEARKKAEEKKKADAEKKKAEEEKKRVEAEKKKKEIEKKKADAEKKKAEEAKKKAEEARKNAEAAKKKADAQKLIEEKRKMEQDAKKKEEEAIIKADEKKWKTDIVLLTGLQYDHKYFHTLGIFTKQRKICNGKASFKHLNGKVFLWWESQNKRWNVGTENNLGSDVRGITTSHTKANSPATFTGVWHVVVNGKWQNTPELRCDVVETKDIMEITFEHGPIGMFFQGNTIQKVEPGSQAENKGVRAGWKVLHVNGEFQPKVHGTGILNAIKLTCSAGKPTVIVFLKTTKNKSQQRNQIQMKPKNSIHESEGVNKIPQKIQTEDEKNEANNGYVSWKIGDIVETQFRGEWKIGRVEKILFMKHDYGIKIKDIPGAKGRNHCDIRPIGSYNRTITPMKEGRKVIIQNLSKNKRNLERKKKDEDKEIFVKLKFEEEKPKVYKEETIDTQAGKATIQTVQEKKKVIEEKRNSVEKSSLSENQGKEEKEEKKHAIEVDMPPPAYSGFGKNDITKTAPERRKVVIQISGKNMPNTDNGKIRAEIEKKNTHKVESHNPIYREQKHQQHITYAGEIFSVGKKRLTFICTIDGEKEYNIKGNIFNVEFLKNKSLNLVKVERINNLADAYKNEVERIKLEESNRKEDISALEEELQRLRERLENQIEDEEKLATDIAKKMLLISQHKRKIAQINTKKEISVTYEETRKRSVIELLPGVATYVLWLNAMVIWCPVERLKSNSKQIDNVKETTEIVTLTTTQPFTYIDHPIDLSHITERDRGIIEILLMSNVSPKCIAQKLQYNVSDIEAYIKSFESQ